MSGMDGMAGQGGAGVEAEPPGLSMEAEPSDAGAREALEALDQGVCVFDRRGGLRLLTARAARLVETFGLPMPVSPVPGAAPPPPATLRAGDRALTLSWRGMAAGGWCALLAEGEAPVRAAGAGLDLPDRDGVARLVSAALDHGDAPGLLMIDLDGFGAVNDQFGRDLGDRLLRVAGSRIGATLRGSDAVGWLGQDEFALLLSPRPGSEGAASVAARVVELLGRPFLVGGQLISISACAGIACAPDHGETAEELLQSAAIALRAARREGRSRIEAYTPDLREAARRRRIAELALRGALGRGEFELFYQPQVRLDSGALTGFEALLRWRHAELGLVSPAEFIPLAEETGLIVPIGEWVARAACRDAAGWAGKLSVALNASPLQIGSDGFAGAIGAALRSSGLAPERLEVEITESVLLRPEPAVQRTLHVLRDLGVRIAMDDFGAGYASLSQIGAFPFDRIKIDRSLVAGSEESLSRRGAIVQAVATLATGLGIGTVAEGIETEAQFEQMRRDGCTLAQGYLISRPVPATEVSAMVARLSGSDAGGRP